jgi:hypothetical protein
MFVRGLILHPDFLHLVKDNGTVDSVCLYCFGTIASLPKKMGLEQKENAHICWSLMQQTSDTELGRKSRSQSARLY